MSSVSTGSSATVVMSDLANPENGYRADIDGLRALALIPVVLFYTGLPFTSGGFVGVDVFFVISGYLITSTLLGDHHAGQYSIWRFYKRRIGGVAPALLAMLMASVVAGALLLDAGQMLALCKNVLVKIVFASNLLFFRQTGHFDLSSEFKPLLHTWSLAVEEQFYILFPLLLSLFIERRTLLRGGGRAAWGFVAGYVDMGDANRT